MRCRGANAFGDVSAITSSPRVVAEEYQLIPDRHDRAGASAFTPHDFLGVGIHALEDRAREPIQKPIAINYGAIGVP